MHPFRFSPLRRRIALRLAASLCATACLLPARLPAAGPPGYVIVPLGRGNFNRLTLAATIEGSKGLMVVDTGAAHTFLSLGKYSSLLPGPNRQLPAGVPKTTSMNGTMVSVGYTRDFQVGGANLGSLPLALVSAHDLYEARLLYGTKDARQYDGFVGEDILRHYNAVVDVGRLVLYLNTDSKRKTDAGPGLVAAGWTRIPMGNYGGDFTASCVLGKKRFRLIVDTGSAFTVLDEHTVRGSQASVVDLPMKGGVIGTNARAEALVMADALEIGGYTATNVHMLSEPTMNRAMHTNFDEAEPVVGLLGGDILGRNNALIDVGNKALYLKPPASAAKP